MLKTLSIILILSTFGCNAQNCDNLPVSFNSYAGATEIITNTSFILSDSIDTSKSSWIRSLKYFSCDNQVGFLMLKTDKKEYLFQNVPIHIWNDFKKADSYGEYYNDFIRGKYQLNLN